MNGKLKWILSFINFIAINHLSNLEWLIEAQWNTVHIRKKKALDSHSHSELETFATPLSVNLMVRDNRDFACLYLMHFKLHLIRKILMI